MAQQESTKFASAWYSKPGLVYFIGAGDPLVAVKIGVTQQDKVKQRLKAIQSSNHEPVRLLGTINVGTLLEAEKKEQELHIRFAAYQRRADGHVGHEWFSAAPEIIEHISTLDA